MSTSEDVCANASVTVSNAYAYPTCPELARIARAQLFARRRRDAIELFNRAMARWEGDEALLRWLVAILGALLLVLIGDPQKIGLLSVLANRELLSIALTTSLGLAVLATALSRHIAAQLRAKNEEDCDTLARARDNELVPSLGPSDDKGKTAAVDAAKDVLGRSTVPKDARSGPLFFCFTLAWVLSVLIALSAIIWFAWSAV
jgi:hypothetical protein